MNPRPGSVLAVAAATLMVWLATRDLPLAARTWTTLLLVPVPALLVVQARALASVEALPRMQVYVSSMVSLWSLALITVGAAYFSGITFESLGLVRTGLHEMLGWMAAVLATALAIVAVARALGIREPPLVAALLPRTRREKVTFAALSVTAGVCEELVFRGFLLGAVLTVTNSLALALIISSGAFGVMHAYQKPSGAARAAFLGMVLAIPFLSTGSLLPSMVAHAGVDLLAGLVLRDRLLR